MLHVLFVHSIYRSFRDLFVLIPPGLQDRRSVRPGNGSPLEKARTPGNPAAAGSCDSSCYGGNATTASTPSRLVQDMQ